MMTKLHQKGQVVVTDLFIAIGVFTILITIITLTWNLYNLRINTTFDYDTMVVRTVQITDTLVKSPGIPSDWETSPSNVTVIALASGERILSQQKVDAFMALTNTQVKDIMHIGLYDFYFVLRNETGAIIRSKGTIPSGQYTVNLARFVIYEDQPRILEFALWQ